MNKFIIILVSPTSLFFLLCSIIADLGSKLNIENSVIKGGLTNSEFDEHTRLSWKYGCSSKCILLNILRYIQTVRQGPQTAEKGFSPYSSGHKLFT